MSGRRVMVLSPWTARTRRDVAVHHGAYAGEGWEFDFVCSTEVRDAYRNLRKAGCRPQAARDGVLALLLASGCSHRRVYPSAVPS